MPELLAGGDDHFQDVASTPESGELKALLALAELNLTLRRQITSLKAGCKFQAEEFQMELSAARRELETAETLLNDIRSSITVRAGQFIRLLLSPASKRRQLLRLIRRTGSVLRREGFRGLTRRMKRRLAGGHKADPSKPDNGPPPVYAYIPPTTTELAQQRTARFPVEPRISIIVPAYNTPVMLLICMIESVRNQSYPKWELIVAEAGRSSTASLEILQIFQRLDSRIRIVCLEKNLGIAGNTNAALGQATGDYVAFLDHDDELALDALFRVVARLNEKPGAEIVYTDQDKIDLDGIHYEPFFKPDWSPEYFRSVMYIGHLLIARRDRLLEIAGCDSRFDGVQDYELMLRLSEKTDRIEHIPSVLYHWRSCPGSIAQSGNAKSNIDGLQEQAVQEHLARLKLGGTAARLGGHRVRILAPAKREWPFISIMIPTRDRPELIETCLRSLYEKTRYPRFEVVLGDNETTDPRALAVFKNYPVRRIPLSGAFHFSRFNNQLARAAWGEFLLLLNNDTEILYTDWLEQLVYHADRPDVGAVGPRLLYPTAGCSMPG